MKVSGIGWTLLCCLVCCSAAGNDAGKKLRILGVFGHLGKSHFDVFKPLLEELARRGHELTVISYFPRSEKDVAAEPLPNYKDISLLTEELSVLVNVVDLRIIDHSILYILKTAYGLHSMASKVCDSGLNNTHVKELVASGADFDLVITESFNTHCFFGLFHRIDAPVIEISTHYLMPWVFNQLGFSSELAYKPSMFAHVTRPLGFPQRMWNVFADWFYSTVVDAVYLWRDQRLAEKNLGPGVPDLSDATRNVSMMLVYTHYSLHGPHPHPPNVVEIGGLHIPKKVNPLPKDIKKFLDEAREGVLYFNLGSMVKTATMPEETLQVVVNVLASLPRKVIWKWETDDLPKKLDNVLIKKWLPQYDILSE
ncbi:UDP-glucosyltransferase 2-like [Augochlora pura]